MTLADLDFDDAPAVAVAPAQPAPQRVGQPAAAAAGDQPKPSTNWGAYPPGVEPKPGDCLYLDLEAVPDDSRIHLFPLERMPDLRLLPDMMPAADFAALTEEKAKQYLDSVSPVDAWFDLAIAAEQAREKGGRKGVMGLLASKRTAQEDRIKFLSVTPMCAKIISIGIQIGDTMPRVVCAEDESAEREILAKTWALIQKFRPVIGFNVLNYDIQLMLIRSAYLGVPVPRRLDTRKFGSSDILDLANVIYPGQTPKGFGMKPTAKMMGLQVADDHGDGSQVFGLWLKRDWESIIKYNAADVAVLADMHQKISGVLCD